MTITGYKGTALGPLTTTWSMPEECSVHVVICPTCTEGFRGQACVVTSGTARAEDHTRCWPPATPAAGTPRWPFMGWGYYSPGLVCPTGYTTACTAEYGGKSEWAVQFTLVPGETAIGCCPVGYRCDNRNGNTCVADADRGHQTVVTTGSCSEGRMVSIGAATLPDIVTFTVTEGDSLGQVQSTRREMILLAPMYQLNFKATDLPKATGKSSSTTSKTAQPTDDIIDPPDIQGPQETKDPADPTDSTSPTPTITPPPQINPNGTSNSNSDSNAASGANADSSASTQTTTDNGLSIGATAGIAVGAAVCTLLLAGLIWWLWQKRQRARQEHLLLDQQQQQQPPPSQWGGDLSPGGPFPPGAYGAEGAAARSWPPEQKYSYSYYSGSHYYQSPTSAGGGGGGAGGPFQHHQHPHHHHHHPQQQQQQQPSELYGGYEGSELHAYVPQELNATGLDRAELESQNYGASPVSATTATTTGNSPTVGAGAARKESYS